MFGCAQKLFRRGVFFLFCWCACQAAIQCRFFFRCFVPDLLFFLYFLFRPMVFIHFILHSKPVSYKHFIDVFLSIRWAVCVFSMTVEKNIQPERFLAIKSRSQMISHVNKHGIVYGYGYSRPFQVFENRKLCIGFVLHWSFNKAATYISCSFFNIFYLFLSTSITAWIAHSCDGFAFFSTQSLVYYTISLMYETHSNQMECVYHAKSHYTSTDYYLPLLCFHSFCFSRNKNGAILLAFIVNDIIVWYNWSILHLMHFYCCGYCCRCCGCSAFNNFPLVLPRFARLR